MHILTRPSTGEARHAVPGLAAREHAGCEALCTPSRPRVDRVGGAEFRGLVTTVVSPRGIAFSLLAGPPQSLDGARRDGPPSLWLALPLEGRLVLTSHRANVDRSVEPLPGDLVCGGTDVACTLALSRAFRLLHVRVPHALLDARLVDPRTLDVAVLRAGGNRLLAGLLASIAGSIAELGAEQLRPLETALIELLTASLRDAGPGLRPPDARAGRWMRVCEAIEAQLGDCELTLQRFAAGQHASPRYIQKLFGEAGSSFSSHLRQRRLERCRADLASPAHEALPIAAICHRWGFVDAAHFSRAFRARFGTTPRAWRNAAAKGSPGG